MSVIRMAAALQAAHEFQRHWDSKYEAERYDLKIESSTKHGTGHVIVYWRMSKPGQVDFRGAPLDNVPELVFWKDGKPQTQIICR